MKVLVTEKISEYGLKILKENVDLDVKTGLSQKEIIDIIDQYDALIVRSATKVNKEILERGANLKVIGRAGNGVDNIDLATATKLGIMVVNTPESNNISTAEHAIALLFALARNIPQANESLRTGKWERSLFKGVELYGKVVTVLGLGRIGSIVASRLKDFGMCVIGYDPYISEKRFEKMGIEKITSMDEVMKRSDFITIHLPKTEETIGIIGEKELNNAKKNLRLINCARGGLIDEVALYHALKNKTIAGAAIDVFTQEPKEGLEIKEFKHPLLELNNVIATPHLGASTTEAQINVGIAISEQVVHALQGKLVSAVNMPNLQIKDMKKLAPYLDLVHKLGMIYYQIEKSPIERIEITYSGEFIREDMRLITLYCLTGLLEPVLKGKVNLINIEMIVKSRGIDIIESLSHQIEYYTNLVSVKIKNKENEVTLAGTIYGKEEPRIVDFMGHKVDFIPASYNLMIKNIDKPGIIGQIGTILGGIGVNIATMKASRNLHDDYALMIINIDSEISKATIKMIQNVDGVQKVNMISL